jgi:hypothetical protein
VGRVFYPLLGSGYSVYSKIHRLGNSSELSPSWRKGYGGGVVEIYVEFLVHSKVLGLVTACGFAFGGFFAVGAEGVTAAAGAGGVGVDDVEAAAHHIFDVIYL